MRFTRLRLKNYLRIFDGLHVYEIDIDLTKSKNNIIMITGGNGKGKTTILDALTFFPDSPGEILANCYGEKYISAVSGSDIYEGTIKYPIDNNGSRGQRKGSFKKNGEELNPNGNITSYKNIIESEFNIDMNFLSLSYLSSMDRGLADKTPAERKHYVNSALNSVDVYNNIHKTLSKKANIFKSHISSLASKIQMIGDINSIEIQMKVLQQRIAQLEDNKSSLEKTIHKLEAGIEIMDPNAKIQNTYNIIAEDIKKLNENLYYHNMDLEKLYSNNSFISKDDNISDHITKEEALFISNNTLCNEMESKLEILKKELESIVDEIKQYMSKKDSLQLNTNIATLKASIAQYKDLISKQDEAFEKLSIYDFNITQDEVKTNFEVLKNIESIISNIYANYFSDNIRTLCENWSYYNIEAYQTISEQVNQKNIAINDLNNSIAYYSELVEESKLLENRPSKCIDDNCFFIRKSIEAKKLNPEKELELLESKLKEEEGELNKLEKELDEFTICLSIRKDIDLLLSIIHKYKISLAKFKTTEVLLDDDILLSALANGKQFYLTIDSNIYNRYINLVEGYKNNKEILNDLLKQYSEYAGKDELINMLNDNIKKASKQYDNKKNEIEILINQIKLKKDIIIDGKNKLDIYRNILTTKDNIKEIEDKKLDLAKQFSDIKENIVKIDTSLNEITRYNSELNTIVNELNAVRVEFEKVKYDLTLLQEYNAEYAEYSKKYEVITLLKKYSSPTNGIQTLYMKLYMDKPLKTTNELLGLFFNGNIRLMDNYIINESEFRIPCIIDELPRDDISSCSNAQTSMISMILSCVLMTQASDSYNVIRLDEIDGSLDHNNRYMFVATLQELMRVLNIEQLFIISHSSELVNLAVDNICLPGAEEICGNIIYNFNDN